MNRRPQPEVGSSRSFAVRIALYFAAMFSTFGIQLPYLQIWLDWRGLSATEISIVLALPALVRILTTPAIAFMADRWAAHRGVLIGASIVALGANLALGAAGGFWSILTASIVLGTAMSTLIPLSETIAMTGVRDAGLDYGRMRLWGSLTFIGANVAGGYAIAAFGNGSIVWAIAAGIAVTVLAGALLPRPMAANGLPTTGRRPISAADAVALVKSRPFLLFIAAVAAVQATHAVMYAFGSLHWRSQGISPAWIGALWAISVPGEVILFAVSGAAVRTFGPMGLMLAGAAAAIVRWSLMAFDPPLAAVVVLQLLHGATYGASHLGAMHFLARAIPSTQAGTAQALYATTTGGAIALATLASGPMFTRFAGQAYLAMVLLAAVSLIAVVVLRRDWDGGVVVGDHAQNAPSGG